MDNEIQPAPNSLEEPTVSLEAIQPSSEPVPAGEPTAPATPLSPANSETLREVEDQLLNFSEDGGYATLRIPIGETRAKSLPNQKVGQDFECVVEDIKSFVNVDVGVLPEGINFDPLERKLFGQPAQDGTFVVSFLGRNRFGKGLVLNCSLVVVPDPRTLWKNLPTDKNAPFFKTDKAVEVDSTANFFAVAASNRGRSHAHEGKFREDDFSLLCVGPATWSVFAVADGGGSYRFSRRGSEIAARVAVKKLASLLEQHVNPLLDFYAKPTSLIHEDQEVKLALYKALVGAGFEAAKAVKEEAESHGESYKDFSTTLLFVAVKKFEIGNVIVGFNIGDGASGVLYNGGKDVYLLCVPESGEFAGQTRFLNTDEFKEENNQGSRIRLTVLQDFDAIAVMSDGVSDAKFPNDNSLNDAKYWRDLIYDDWLPSVMPLSDPIKGQFPQVNAELKQRANDWLDYWVPGTHDDRTLIVGFPKGDN